MSAAASSAGEGQSQYGFDPHYGYTLDELLEVRAPAETADFAAFWRPRYERAVQITPATLAAELTSAAVRARGRRQFAVRITSWGGLVIGGWLSVPAAEDVQRGLVVTHGYGGREGPDPAYEMPHTAVLFPVLRGLPASSLYSDLPAEPAAHVVHGIADPANYLVGLCVADVWVAVNALLDAFPQVAGRIGYAGSSFGGGVGALALAWETRVARAFLEVPTFGHQPLRASLPSLGSADGVQQRLAELAADPARSAEWVATERTLALHDAAVAARHVEIPVLVAAALFDPAVAPPGQFAIYNSLPRRRGVRHGLFVMPAGHHDYPGLAAQSAELRAAFQEFFADL